jgi:hypothetical protein
MYLNAVNHEFDFDDTGAVTFTIEYQAYLENYFGTQEFDVFGSTGVEKQIRMLFLDHFKKLGCTLQTNSEFKTFMETDEKFIINAKANVMRKINERLISSGKIRFLHISPNQIIDWYENPRTYDPYSSGESPPPTPPPTEPDAAAAAAAAGSTESPENNSEPPVVVSTAPPIDETTVLSFYYLGDILEAVMDNITESLENIDFDSSQYVAFVNQSNSDGKLTPVIEAVREKFNKSKDTVLTRQLQFQKMRILLGPLNLILNAGGSPINCSLGDIPISHNYFISFLDSKINSRNLSNYPFSKFVNELIRQLLGTFLNSRKCPSSTKYKKVKINNSVVSAYNLLPEISGSKDDLTTLIIKNGMEKNYFEPKKVVDSFPILGVSGPKNDPRSQLDIKDIRNYYVFFAGSQPPEKENTGDREYDENKGVFHYTLGENKGIVKNIVLQKSDTPFLKTTRFEQEGYDGLTQLREVYNVSIDTFFNPQTAPGTYIFVEPKGFDPTVAADEDLTKYGIGGYLMIIKSSHSITPGQGNSQIVAQWVASADGAYTKVNRTVRKEQGGEAVDKCTVFSAGSAPSNTTTP